MINVHPAFKKVALVAALLAGAVGVAYADDSSNGGRNLPYDGNPTFTQAPSAWRQSHPNGLSEQTLQSDSAWAPVWHPSEFALAGQAPSAWRESHPDGLSERVLQARSSFGPASHRTRLALASAPATPASGQTYPNGLTEREFQALSSESPAWQLRNAAITTSVASVEQGPVAQGAAG